MKMIGKVVAMRIKGVRYPPTTDINATREGVHVCVLWGRETV